MSELTELYFSSVRNRDAEALAALFTEDAMMILPDGRELAGRAAIRGMYDYLFSTTAPSPTPIASVIGANAVATEIEARLPDGTIRRTANFFHLDGAGLIRRLSVYARG